MGLKATCISETGYIYKPFNKLSLVSKLVFEEQTVVFLSIVSFQTCLNTFMYIVYLWMDDE